MKSFYHPSPRLGLLGIFLTISTLCIASNDAVEVIHGKGNSGKNGLATGKSRSPYSSDRLDQDGNKKLSIDELLAEHQRQIKAFAQADKNHDGELSAAEQKVFKKSIKLKSFSK